MNPLSDGIGNEPKWNVHIPINPNGKQEEKQPHKGWNKKIARRKIYVNGKNLSEQNPRLCHLSFIHHGDELIRTLFLAKVGQNNLFEGCFL